MDVFSDSSTVRLNREQMSGQSMVRLKNPFMFKICEESVLTDNYRNGLKLSILCDNSFWVISYWAVNIEELHHSLTDDWQPMRQSLLDQNFIDNNCLFKSEPELYYETNEQIVHLIKPANDYFRGESLGYNPRTRYPLVVIIVRNDDDDGIELNDNDVQIFTPESDYEPQSNQFCVVCQTSLISHAMLPCRHSCLCGQCFERVDKCPLCRSSITSFFRIREDQDFEATDLDTDVTNVPNNSSQTNTNWFSALNNKLNQWFGMN